MHPLGPNLTGLSDADLQKKYSELQKRLGQAYRFGPQSIIPQLQMIMEDYQAEISLRMQKQMAELDKSSKNPKGIIDIS
jgi:ribosomal protein L29